MRSNKHRRLVVIFVGLSVVGAGCSISTEHPGLLPDNPVLRRPVITELDPASTADSYRFTSWLSFPAIGPWTYDIGGDFSRFAAALDRQALSTTGDTTQQPLRLRLSLVGYEINTVYRGSCSIRGTLIDPTTDKVLLDRNYLGTGRTAFLRVFGGGWFFGIGTRSGVRATMDSAFTAAFDKIATDVSSAASDSVTTQHARR